MGHLGPVIYFPLDASKLPAQLENWLSVEDLLSEARAHRSASGWRSSTSKNWWHQDALNQLRLGLGLRGLEFINAAVAYLDRPTLAQAATELDFVMSQLEHGVLDVGEAEVG